MAENTLKARLQMKSDTEANWIKAVNFTPKKGEIIVYLADETHFSPRIKIGNGSSNVNDLPFLSNSSPEFILSTNEESSASLTGTLSFSNALENGKEYLYFTQQACPGTALTLTLTYADANTSEAIPIYNYGEVACNIAYPANCVIHLVYYNQAFYLVGNNISVTN